MKEKSKMIKLDRLNENASYKEKPESKYKHRPYRL